MDKFKDACKQSCEDWANSFDDAQDYEFSSAFESKMEKLQDEIETKKHRKPSKKIIALLVNAAVILCFCTAVLIIPAAREQVVGIFKGYVSDSGISSGEDTTIWSDDTEFGGENGSYGNYETLEIYLGYIPEGFTVEDEVMSGALGDSVDTDKSFESICYENGDSWFAITKYIGNSGYDGKNHKTFRIDGIDYDVIEEDDDFIKIFWNKESEYFILRGSNVNRVELLKIAVNAE